MRVKSIINLTNLLSLKENLNQFANFVTKTNPLKQSTKIMTLSAKFVTKPSCIRNAMYHALLVVISSTASAWILINLISLKLKICVIFICVHHVYKFLFLLT